MTSTNDSCNTSKTEAEQDAQSAVEEYTPSPLDFANAEERIREGRARISENGSLIINTDHLAESNTLAICALLSWCREAKAKNCRLQFTSPPPRLRKLIQVYQLESILLTPTDLFAQTK